MAIENVGVVVEDEFARTISGLNDVRLDVAMVRTPERHQPARSDAVPHGP